MKSVVNVILCVFIKSDVILSVVMKSVVMLSVVAPGEGSTV
jgi:hypothetical protein